MSEPVEALLLGKTIVGVDGQWSEDGQTDERCVLRFSDGSAVTISAGATHYMTGWLGFDTDASGDKEPRDA